MVKPVSSRRTSPKSMFEAAVKTFDEPIGLRMVGGVGCGVGCKGGAREPR